MMMLFYSIFNIAQFSTVLFDFVQYHILVSGYITPHKVTHLLSVCRQRVFIPLGSSQRRDVELMYEKQ